MESKSRRLASGTATRHLDLPYERLAMLREALNSLGERESPLHATRLASARSCSHATLLFRCVGLLLGRDLLNGWTLNFELESLLQVLRSLNQGRIDREWLDHAGDPRHV